VLEHSSDYIGDKTLDQFEDDSIYTALCEVQIKKPAEQKISKKETVYYKLFIEDSNGKTGWVTIWEDDYLKFKDEFDYFNVDKNTGHLIKIRLQKPFGGFNGFTFESPPKNMKHKIPKEKHKDYRLMLMKYPEDN
jgi:hypothetical protein